MSILTTARTMITEANLRPRPDRTRQGIHRKRIMLVSKKTYDRMCAESMLHLQSFLGVMIVVGDRTCLNKMLIENYEVFCLLEEE